MASSDIALAKYCVELPRRCQRVADAPLKISLACDAPDSELAGGRGAGGYTGAWLSPRQVLLIYFRCFRPRQIVEALPGAVRHAMEAPSTFWTHHPAYPYGRRPTQRVQQSAAWSRDGRRPITATPMVSWPKCSEPQLKLPAGPPPAHVMGGKLLGNASAVAQSAGWMARARTPVWRDARADVNLGGSLTTGYEGPAPSPRSRAEHKDEARPRSPEARADKHLRFFLQRPIAAQHYLRHELPTHEQARLSEARSLSRSTLKRECDRINADWAFLADIGLSPERSPRPSSERSCARGNGVVGGSSPAPRLTLAELRGVADCASAGEEGQELDEGDTVGAAADAEVIAEAVASVEAGLRVPDVRLQAMIIDSKGSGCAQGVDSASADPRSHKGAGRRRATAHGNAHG